MNKINNEFLKEYLQLDREIKIKSKKLHEMKNKIVKELEKRKHKAIVTRFYIASFKISQRPVFNIPTEIKNKFREMKDYNILQVLKRKGENEGKKVEEKK